ncbi:MAG: undecaprenyl-diphosphatase UppP [Eubacteriales bacterium]
MFVWQAIVMGIIQGIGEFLPISSSGHLVLLPWLFDWTVPGITFDVALHMGTLLAVLVYFWKDWLKLLTSAVTGKNDDYRKIFWYLVVATIPAGVAGFFMEDLIQNIFRSPIIIGIMLIVFGLFLYFADKKTQLRKLESMNLPDALVIGIAQCMALVPGVSRSGVTMTAARMLSYSREEAARFSFLLSTPVIFGAGVFELSKINPAEFNTAFIAGILVSAIVGLASITFLLRYLKSSDFKIFVGYRIILGLIIIGLYL